MVSILINIIQHEQYDLIIYTINRPKGCNFIKKETLAHMVSCELCQISRNNNFLYRTFQLGHVFGLSFVNHRKKSMKELVK